MPIEVGEGIDSDHIDNASGTVVGRTEADAIDQLESEIAAIPGPELTADELAAINGAAAPTGANVFATMGDLPGPPILTADEIASINGAAGPTALNPMATMADLTLLMSQVIDSAMLIVDGTEEIFTNSTFPLAANSLQVGDVIEVEAADNVLASGATTVTQRIRLGGLVGLLIHAYAGQAAAGVYGIRSRGVVRAIGVGGSIEWFSEPIVGTMIDLPSRATTAINTTIANNLVMTGQWSGNDALNNAVSFMFNIKQFRV